MGRGSTAGMEAAVLQKDEMLALARSRSAADRERLLLAMVDLCNEGEGLTSDSKGLVSEIFMSLVIQAEQDIRRRLAEKLATASWAPHALIQILALDDIEIARPIIARSAALDDADLVRLLVEATLEHQIEVARRPGIGGPVVNAILDASQPAVLTALAGNTTAEVTAADMQRLVMASRRVVAMRGALVRHPKLTEDLAHTLYGWVGDALRASIGERFTIDPALLADTVSEAVAEAYAGAGGAEAGSEPPPDAEAQREQREMEWRLVAKLEMAGQLRPGYLLRSLREGRGSLFEAALSVLGEYDVDDIRHALAADRADLLAYACAGIGIDRSVFPTMLGLVQELNQGRPAVGPAVAERIGEAFKLSQAEAAQAFREGSRAI